MSDRMKPVGQPTAATQRRMDSGTQLDAWTDNPDAGRAIWGRGLPENAPRPGSADVSFADARRYVHARLPQQMQELRAQQEQRAAVAAPTMRGAPMDTRNADQVRARQMALATALERAGGPSIAAGIGTRDRERALVAGFARGGARGAALATQAGAVDTASGVAGALADATGRRQALALALSGDARRQDIGQATTRAELDQAESTANLRAALQARQQINEMTRYYTSTGLTLQQAQTAAWREYEQSRLASGLQRVATANRVHLARAEQEAQIAGGIMSGISALGSAAANIAGGVKK